MNTNLKALSLIAISSLLPHLAFAQSAVGLGIVGKFYVSSVRGAAECVTQANLADANGGGLIGEEGRITVLRKGRVIVGNGAVISTGKGSSATLVFSNQTAMFLDENTEIEVRRFDQEPFAPNNNLLIEPSNSATRIILKIGRVVVDTPRLQSGTRMAFETRHANIDILNVEPAGEKVFIEVTEKQTHVAMIQGEADVTPLGAHVVTRLTTGKQAYVKYTIGSQIGVEELTSTAAGSGAPAPVRLASPATTASAVPAQPAAAPSDITGTERIEATVLKLSGAPLVRLPGDKGDGQLRVGDKLPEGAVIITPADSEVFVQPFDGAVADIKPKSRVQIARLEIATNQNGVIRRQTALLDLQAGFIVSVIDPAKRAINDYGVNTPKGIVHAHGTSFAVELNASNLTILATADTLSLDVPGGSTYSISQGNVIITPAGGQPQEAVSIASALASDPSLAATLQSAVTTVTGVVTNNLGNIPERSSTTLLAQVVAIASAAIPSQASSFATQAVNAVTAPTSANPGNAGTAVAAVIGAIAAAAPAQAAQVAAAAATAAPSFAPTAAAAAAQSVPAQAASIASAVTTTITNAAANPGSAQTTQAAANVAGAVSAAVSSQAAAVAASVATTLSQAAPQGNPLSTAQTSASIAAAATAAAPQQAGAIATAVLSTVTSASGATPQSNLQGAAVFATAMTTAAQGQAGSVAAALAQAVIQANAQASAQETAGAVATVAAAATAAAPTQAASVAGAVMNTVLQSAPAASAMSSGVVASAVSQSAPASQTQSIVNAVAVATNQSSDSIQQAAQQSSAQGTQAAQQGSQNAVQTALNSAATTLASTQASQSSGQSLQSATFSVSVAAGTSDSSGAGTSGTSGAPGVTQTAGATVVPATTGLAEATGITRTGTAGAASTSSGSSTTYIIVSALSGGSIGGLSQSVQQGLESTNSAGSSVSFTPTTDPNGTTSVQAAPTTQTTPPTNDVTSAAVQP
jgi:hypothetical protein